MDANQVVLWLRLAIHGAEAEVLDTRNQAVLWLRLAIRGAEAEEVPRVPTCSAVVLALVTAIQELSAQLTEPDILSIQRRFGSWFWPTAFRLTFSFRLF